ncbi:LacI family DNA-binding transcriptional regulator [Lysinibacillus odysseyi]|uniref:Ribose operon repressor n=1 Tax=Lysinibacillus odysseyi 34hs-1 = NBRC 100172 TaxID=1220589 RepID=A0A0A3IQA9_9BACI|nr:LacI family DNA-binding transcriptional regulator [Lysinibacillus odysseyi]KGR85053.1 ribose operon repressor [Lysinibacillus odysseyi 34hs-1 = NBRC 100172]
MATIKDVAKHAGVSVATVSRYLNKKGYVSEEAKNKIEVSIKQLDYRPNDIARSLSTKRMQTIGLIVPDITNPFFPEIARAIEDTALLEGYTVVLCNSDEQVHKERHYIETLKQKYVAGFIIATNQLEREYYTGLNVPLVLLDRITDSQIPSVSSRNKNGAALGTEYLLSCGVKEIACISGPQDVVPAFERTQGFLKAVEGLDIKTHIVESQFHFKEAEKAAFELLSAHPGIDGIFAGSDIIAIGVQRAVHRLGLSVPNDIQIVGYDGISLGEMVTPSLTTVDQNIYQLGETAVKMLLNIIKGKSVDNEHVIIDPSLIVRDSTKEKSK